MKTEIKNKFIEECNNNCIFCNEIEKCNIIKNDELILPCNVDFRYDFFRIVPIKAKNPANAGLGS